MNIRFWQRREAARVYQSIRFANHARTDGEETVHDAPQSVGLRLTPRDFRLVNHASDVITGVREPLLHLGDVRSF
jgi:hypothetical protein